MSESEFMLLDADYDRRQRNQLLFKVLVIGLTLISGFVVLTLIISGSTPDLKPPKFVVNCSLGYNYDFNLLTLRWPSSVCEDEKCVKHEDNKWLIHGLWPTYANQSWPQFCCSDEEFDSKTLEPIKSDLMTLWPNLMVDKSDDSLWRHEWTKHGTCTRDKQIQYFNNTLNLYKKFPIYEWLKSNGILPSDNKSYDLQTFVSTITDKIRHKVQIKCVKKVLNSGKKSVIEELLICINRNTTNDVIDCPEESTCPKNFYYPKT